MHLRISHPAMAIRIRQSVSMVSMVSMESDRACPPTDRRSFVALELGSS
jgi:hypothetical protein